MRWFICCFIWTSAAWGCSCMGVSPVCQAAAQAEAVFSGRVLAITYPTVDQSKGRSDRFQRTGPRVDEFALLKRTVRLRVTKHWLGVSASLQEVEVRTGFGDSDCGYPFVLSEEYLVYAYRSARGDLEASICTRTRPISAAGEDIAWLGSMADAPKTADVPVRAMEVGGNGDRRALTGVQVRITGPRTAVGITDEAGVYVFADLPQGEYTVHAERQGYTLAVPVEPIRVIPRSCAALYIWMQPLPIGPV